MLSCQTANYKLVKCPVIVFDVLFHKESTVFIMWSANFFVTSIAYISSVAINSFFRVFNQN